MKNVYKVGLHGLDFGVIGGGGFSLSPVDDLHILPKTPIFFAGIAALGGKTSRAYDLSACLGFDPLEGKNLLYAFSLSGPESHSFCFSGNVKKIEIDEEGVRPLPERFRTDVLHSYFLDQQTIVPVIDLEKLTEQIFSSPEEFHASRPSFLLSPHHPADTGMITLFQCGEFVFAMQNTMLEAEFAGKIALSAFPHQPGHVSGLCVYNGEVTPVFDFARRLRVPFTSAPEDLILFLKFDSEIAGIVVGALINTFDTEPEKILPLPPLLASPWMTGAFDYEGELVPVVDSGVLFQEGRDTDGRRELLTRYRPDSVFSTRFRHEDLAVIEFSLLGKRHALPKDEVADVIPYAEAAIFPGLPPLSTGAVHYKGELVPVLDITRYLDKDSIPNDHWRLLLVRNGDFAAFVLTEQVFEERSLPVAEQRDLPVVLPSPIVYGCYPHKEYMILILNVYQMALHFGKSGIKNFYQALFQEAYAILLKEEETAASVGAFEEAAELIPEEPAVRNKTDTSDRAEELLTVAETAVSERVSLTETGDRAGRTSDAHAPARRAPDKSIPDKTMSPPDKKRPSLLVPVIGSAAAIAFLVLLFFFFTGRPVTRETTEKKAPSVATSTATPPVRDGEAAALSTNKSPPPPRLVREGDYLTYSIVPGDTLADISWAFTGSGYNFPKIAEENGITNPNLIFPRQKIKIRVAADEQ